MNIESSTTTQGEKLIEINGDWEVAIIKKSEKTMDQVNTTKVEFYYCEKYTMQKKTTIYNQTPMYIGFGKTKKKGYWWSSICKQ